MANLDSEIASSARSLMDDYRERCLWFLRADYCPQTAAEIIRVLEWRKQAVRE
ncbi:MAG TPA: hypothetical protein VHL58_15315 [Thermoanaerobaculia bacterium]|nr:hypothetical protein [Thermoanaerobaculia bacterium]